MKNCTAPAPIPGEWILTRCLRDCAGTTDGISTLGRYMIERYTLHPSMHIIFVRFAHYAVTNHLQKFDLGHSTNTRTPDTDINLVQTRKQKARHSYHIIRAPDTSGNLHALRRYVYILSYSNEHILSLLAATTLLLVRSMYYILYSVAMKCVIVAAVAGWGRIYLPPPFTSCLCYHTWYMIMVNDWPKVAKKRCARHTMHLCYVINYCY